MVANRVDRRPLSDNHEESAEGMALAIFMWAEKSKR
jgi:hypothetical protein